MNRSRVVTAAAVLLAVAGIAYLYSRPEPAAEPAPGPVAEPTPEAPSPSRVAALRSTNDAGPTGVKKEEEADEAIEMDAPEEDSEVAAALRAELAQWEASEVVHAVCEISPPLPAAEGYLSIGQPDQFNGRKVIVLDGQAYLPILEGHPVAGHLSIEGYKPEPLRWELPEAEMGRCEPGVISLEPGGTVVTGRVTHTGTDESAPGAWVEGCGNLGRTDEEGVYYLEAIPGPCTLIAMRQDGRLRALSAPEPVVVEDGKDLVVDLEIQRERQAGLGIQLEQTEEGHVLVSGLVEGGAAEAAGLAEGDIVLAVDGDPVAEMEMSEFVAAAGGVEGSEVTLTLLDPDAESGEREITFERSVLE